MTTTKKSSARVFEPKVWPEVHKTQNLTCESSGKESLNCCLWGRTVDGHYEIILGDQDIAQNSGQTATDGILYVVEGLGDGKCRIQIESVKPEDFGPWSCTLVAKMGQVFTGNINVEPTRSILKGEYVTGLE